MQRHAVHRGRHAVLTHAVVDIAAGEIVGVMECVWLVLVLLEPVRRRSRRSSRQVRR